ncbi:type II and III secretion system protein family protein [Leisingera sp. S232]|uniref:type II and III secretion system protein family protein n=1 Tax=Leisingera sp. S232 TaxID=3415132 RepID=UPI003C7B5263
MPADAQVTQRMVVEEGKGKSLSNLGQAESIFVADTSVADVSTSPGEAAYIFGKAVGDTTLIATGTNGEILFEIAVSVTHNLRGLRATLSQRFPGEAISLASARGSIFVSGVVSTERVHENVLETLRNSVPSSALIDELVVRDSQLIQLEVRLMEISVDQAENYGIDWNGLVASSGFSVGAQSGNSGVISFGYDETDPATSVDATVDLLVDSGIATLVTQSSLTTVSGKDADFSVGEEIAIPTFSGQTDPANGNFSIDYKFVGMNVKFKPQMLPGSKLRLEVNSVISGLQPATTTINGNAFPNLSTRRFATNVELRDNQSFVIAGLSRQETRNTATGESDTIFASTMRRLLGSDSISSSKRELIAVITPRFGNLERRPVEQILARPMSNLEHILSQYASKAGSIGKVEVHGPAGFLY